MRLLFPLAVAALAFAPAAQAQSYHRGWDSHRGFEGPRVGWSVGWSYGYPAYGYPAYGGYDYLTSNARSSGTFWGAVAGAIIGNNSGSLHHSAGLGALYGAGVGYVLGSIADANNARSVAAVGAPIAGARVERSGAASDAPTWPGTASTALVGSAAATTPMSAANSLFGR